jgi:hypothetical protein
VNIGWICIKINYEDFIRFLIGWFYLIMSLIKGLIKFINYFRPKLSESIKCNDLIRLVIGQINFIKDLIGEKISLKA